MSIDDPDPIETPAIVRFVQTWRRAVERELTQDQCHPTELRPGCPDQVVVPVPVPRQLEQDDARDLATAAERAVTAYPGPVGELVAREIRAHRDFGHRFGNDRALVARLVRDVLGGDRATSNGPVPDRPPGPPPRQPVATTGAGACPSVSSTRVDTTSR